MHRLELDTKHLVPAKDKVTFNPNEFMKIALEESETDGEA